MRFLILLLPTAAFAQIDNPMAVDDTARTMALSAAADAASKCDPAAVVPPTETVGGAAGSGINCRLANAVQPRISRFVAFTTGSDGTVAVTWQSMGSTPAGANIQENVASNATNVPKCYPVTGTLTATGVTVKCYITQSILGLGVIPFTTATAGVTGTVLALPGT